MTDVTSGEPNAQQHPGHWSGRATLAAIGVAAIIGVLGGGAVYAATESGGSGGPGGPGFGPPPPGGFGSPGAPAGQHPGARHTGVDTDPAVLHGQFVLPDGRGGYTTEMTQTGSITDITATSVTARSEDGFTQTYAIPPVPNGAPAPFGVHDRVTIRATHDGTENTVITIDNARGPAAG